MCSARTRKKTCLISRKRDSQTFFSLKKRKISRTPFLPPAHTAQPLAAAGSMEDAYRASSPLLSVDLQDACKSAAENLNIPWPTVVAETAKSRYKGKRLPRAKRAARQLLPVFPGGACSDLEGQTIHQQVTRAGRIRSRCGGNGEGRTSPNAPHGAISCRAFAAKAHGGCKSDVAIQSVPFPVKHDGTRL